MHSVHVLLRILTSMLLATLAACSSGDDDAAGDSNDDEQMERATAVCARRCDKEIATRCESTPTGRRDTCIAACTKKYSDHPDCRSDLLTLDSCRAVGGTYTCDASGMPLLGPVGLCKTELETCTSCTGASAESGCL